jgi:hypothetical protein
MWARNIGTPFTLIQNMENNMFELIEEFFAAIAAEHKAYMASSTPWEVQHTNGTWVELEENLVKARDNRIRCWDAVIDGLTAKRSTKKCDSAAYNTLSRAITHYLELHVRDGVPTWNEQRLPAMSV